MKNTLQFLKLPLILHPKWNFHALDMQSKINIQIAVE